VSVAHEVSWLELRVMAAQLGMREVLQVFASTAKPTGIWVDSRAVVGCCMGLVDWQARTWERIEDMYTLSDYVLKARVLRFDEIPSSMQTQMCDPCGRYLNVHPGWDHARAKLLEFSRAGRLPW
jgi:hypothetical protein